MGLFDKKYCDICGEKIGLLGNRKLENGNLCKNCARKLSPWFSDRRGSTVEEIRAQLAYRAENQEKVAAFHTTRTLGADTKVLLDEDAGKFMVTRARNLAEANPDVLDFADVTAIMKNAGMAHMGVGRAATSTLTRAARSLSARTMTARRSATIRRAMNTPMIFISPFLSTIPISTKCASRSTPVPWTLRRRLERVLA